MPQYPSKALASLLHCASQGDLSGVQQALFWGAPLNGRDEEGRTALMLAAMNLHEPMVGLLLEHGAKVNLVDRHGESAAIHALYPAGVARDTPGEKLDVFQHQVPMKNILIQLLKNGAFHHPKDQQGNHLFALVFRKLPHHHVLELLNGFLPAQSMGKPLSKTVLHWLAELKLPLNDVQQGLVDLCVWNGVPLHAVDAQGKTALDCARERGHDLWEKALTNAAMAQEKTRETLALAPEQALAFQRLMEATGQGDVTQARRALEDGAPIDHTDERLRTPLMVAARRLHPAMVTFLISQGANLEMEDAHGETAVIHALKPQGRRRQSPAFSALRMRTSDVLMRAGCNVDIDVTDENDLPIFFLALHRLEKRDSCRLFRTTFPMHQVGQSTGSTFFHLLALDSFVPPFLARFLVKLGVNRGMAPEMRRGSNPTAAEVCREMGNTTLLNAIHQYTGVERARKIQNRLEKVFLPCENPSASPRKLRM